MLSTRRAEQLIPLCCAVPTWPIQRTLSGSRFSAPALAAEQELELGCLFGSGKEELLNPRFPVRHAVSDECQIASEAIFRRDRKMSAAIQTVINRKAILGPEPQVVLDDRIATTISKDKIVLRNEPPERVSDIYFDTRQGCGSIHIPKCHPRMRRADVEDFTFQPFIVGADAAVFDDEVGKRSLVKHLVQIARRLIDPLFSVLDRRAITILLPFVNIRFRKCDMVAKFVQISVNSAVIGGCPVPIA